jgi:hypothetical protein
MANAARLEQYCWQHEAGKGLSSSVRSARSKPAPRLPLALPRLDLTIVPAVALTDPRIYLNSADARRSP